VTSAGIQLQITTVHVPYKSPGMLMRPAKCEAEARYHKAEVEAKAKEKFVGLTPNSVRPRPDMLY